MDAERKELQRQASRYLTQVAKFLRRNGCEPVIHRSAASYSRMVGYGAKGFGGIVYEGSVPFAHCDSLADAVNWASEIGFPEPPHGLFVEPSTSWAIALYES